MEKYTDLSKKLGQGSFGSVKLVQRKHDQKLVAMKIIDLAAEEAVEAAYNEPNMLETLKHTNIVKFHETFVLKDRLYLIMEYCEQGDLQQKAQEAKVKGEYFSEEQILEWFVQVCLAVKQLHDHRIIHRDIKVHNVFLTSEGIVKLGDFGISKKLENTGDLGKTWLGTPYYVSPEMLSHSVSSYKSDTWMLGCLLYELCSLEKPFPGNNYAMVMRKIMFEDFSPAPEHYSDFIHDLIEGLLQKNPEKRFSIGHLFQLPQIREQVELLVAKYPEAYEHETSLDFLKIPPHPEIAKEELQLGPKRWVSEKLGHDNFMKIHDNQRKQKAPINMNTLELHDPLQDSRTQVVSSKPPVPDLQAVKWKSTNIRALVEQRKATLSPSNIDKITNISSSTTAVHTPHQNFLTTSSIQSNSSSKQAQNGIIRPIRVASVQYERSESAWEEKKVFATMNSFEADDFREQSSEREEQKYDEKTGSCLSKKHINLSINIPIGPEQGESQSQVTTEKAQPQVKLTKSPLNDPNAVPTTKVEGIKKSFAFSDYVFDKKLPTSPNRNFWVSQFLKQKLGDEKFEKVRDLIENSTNPTQLLKEQPEKVLEIIGEDKKDCLVMLNFLISHNTNSVTPTGEGKSQMDKYPYMRTFDTSRNTRNFKSPSSANPFLRNVFPCATEPDSVGSQSPIEDLRSSRRVFTDMFSKQKEKFEPFSASLPNTSEIDKEINCDCNRGKGI